MGAFTGLLLILILVLTVAVLLLLLAIYKLLRQPTPPPTPPPSPPYKVPSEFNESGLATSLSLRLAGSPSDGSKMNDGTHPQKVVWVDKGDEVLVHLDSTQVRLLDKTLICSVDLETDQTGRTPLVVVFAMGDPQDPAGLIVTTDQYPRGNGVLAARWGKALQAALWAGLLGLVQEHAQERGLAARGIGVVAGKLSFHPGTPLSAAAVISGS